jgi:hypothetical protein
VETLVKENKKNPSSTPTYSSVSGTDWDPEIDRISEAFSEQLKAAVHLKNGIKGKGKIIISYKNREDLERILNLIQS